ncbi:Hypothetical protein SMAX5B_001826 [Scophthalmus maximus]|uniref:Uncharacterized protein n=1 Tax=Scophthalmus maximus TaxID=52904 RepID=A0A2U9CXC8_SCOMX|nr:Hypothetical protein SMAX5B_001826 [Scophthalmus maximus]
MFTQDLVGYRLGGGECGTCEAGNLTDFGMKGRECSVDRKGGDGIVAVTRTAGEDQVRCGDPRPCVASQVVMESLCMSPSPSARPAPSTLTASKALSLVGANGHSYSYCNSSP